MVAKELTSISVLGCGWLGFPLAKDLVKEGYQVKGSTTSYEKLELLSKSGIEPFLIKIYPGNEEGDLAKFLETDFLIINIPPGTKRNPPQYHIDQMKVLVDSIKKGSVSKIIYVSSTSVYPDLNRTVFEKDVESAAQSANKALGEAEEMVKDLGREWCILRMAGLSGYDRMLARHFAGKSNLPFGRAPVNLIHRDDCTKILSEIIKGNTWNQIFNCCAPVHPSRSDFYKKLAAEYNLPAPGFIDEKGNWKEISTDKLIATFNFKYKFPDPFLFEYKLNS